MPFTDRWPQLSRWKRLNSCMKSFILCLLLIGYLMLCIRELEHKSVSVEKVSTIEHRQVRVIMFQICYDRFTNLNGNIKRWSLFCEWVVSSELLVHLWQKTINTSQDVCVIMSCTFDKKQLSCGNGTSLWKLSQTFLFPEALA